MCITSGWRFYLWVVLTQAMQEMRSPGGIARIQRLRLRAEFAIDKSSLEAWVVIGCCVEGGAVSVQ